MVLLGVFLIKVLKSFNGKLKNLYNSPYINIVFRNERPIRGRIDG